MNKYELGECVYSNRYEINSAIIVGIEQVSSYPDKKCRTLNEYLEYCDTYQYCLAYYDPELYDTTTCWLYEQYLND